MNRPVRVLIIEDSELDAQLLLRHLPQGGCEPEWQRVETAAALTAACGWNPNPEAVPPFGSRFRRPSDAMK